jgi:hypothetical protein
VAGLLALGGIFDVLTQEEMGEDLILDLSRKWEKISFLISVGRVSKVRPP